MITHRWIDRSDVNGAGGDLLQLDRRLSEPFGDRLVPIERQVGGAIDKQVVVAGGPVADLPPDPAVDLDEEEEEAVGLVLLQGVAEEGGDGDALAGEVRGPDVDVLVALVEGRDPVGEGDLLGLVGGVDVEAVVVDADAVVGVVGGDGDLEGGSEVVGAGEVELGEGEVADVEFGLGGAEDEPDDEDGEEDEDDEGEDDGEEAAVQLLALAVGVLVAGFGRHGC